MDILEGLNQCGLTKEQYEDCLQMIMDKKDGVIDVDWNEIIQKYNLPIVADSLRRVSNGIFSGAFVMKYMKEYADKNTCDMSSKVSQNKDISFNKDGSMSSSMLLRMTEEQAKNPEFVLKAHGFDIDTWELSSCRNTVREVVSKVVNQVDKDGELVDQYTDKGKPVYTTDVRTLYASYITVKPRKDGYLAFSKIKKFYEELIEDDHRPIIKKNENKQTNLMLEIPIVDVHFGKLSLSEDVAEPYNYNLAKQRFNCVIDDVIDSVKDKQIEKIVFPIGNDFFNIDTYKSTTTAGTQQNCDLSPHLIFKYGVECLIENIIKLTDIAPVEVFCINGNHDFLSSYHALYSIYCYFHNNENVIINTGTRPRKYIEFGNVLLGFTHGDKEKNRIGGLMQIEAREAWGRTKYHEIHTGHWHSEQITKESGGVIIRNLSSFTGSDLWHNENGYVGAIKKCQSFLWDKNKGLKSIIVSTID